MGIFMDSHREVNPARRPVVELRPAGEVAEGIRRRVAEAIDAHRGAGPGGRPAGRGGARRAPLLPHLIAAGVPTHGLHNEILTRIAMGVVLAYLTADGPEVRR